MTHQAVQQVWGMDCLIREIAKKLEDYHDIANLRLVNKSTAEAINITSYKKWITPRIIRVIKTATVNHLMARLNLVETFKDCAPRVMSHQILIKNHRFTALYKAVKFYEICRRNSSFDFPIMCNSTGKGILDVDRELRNCQQIVPLQDSQLILLNDKIWDSSLTLLLQPIAMCNVGNLEDDTRPILFSLQTFDWRSAQPRPNIMEMNKDHALVIVETTKVVAHKFLESKKYSIVNDPQGFFNIGLDWDHSAFGFANVNMCLKLIKPSDLPTKNSYRFPRDLPRGWVRHVVGMRGIASPM